LTHSDLRAIFRLLGEIRELSGDMTAWRRHMAEELSRLIRSRVAITFERAGGAERLQKRLPLQIVGLVDTGWHCDSDREHLFRYFQCGYADAPYMESQMALLMNERRVTVGRRRMVGDRRWYGSAHFNEVRRAARLDDFIYSNLPVGKRLGNHQLGFHRTLGDQRFTPRDRRLVALFHEELGRLWHDGEHEEPLDHLPRRMRETVELLLAGDSEKQVASKLGIARNTVHRYVGMLHRHYNVHSRGELVAHCQTLLQKARFRPRLYLRNGD
jgi:DNA-binding CsgD family transcriptional regulator